MDTIWIIVFFNYVSFVSILIVLYLFIVSEKYKFFVYRTILYLQISDSLSALSYIIITFSSTYIFIYLHLKFFLKDDQSQDVLCQMHAFLENSGKISSVCFTMLISTVLLFMLRFHSDEISKYEVRIVLYIFIFPIIYSTMSYFFISNHFVNKNIIIILA